MNESTMLDKLYYLEKTKSDIRDSLINRGVSVPSDTPFREYAELIDLIGSEELILIEQYKEGILSVINRLNRKFGLRIPLEVNFNNILSSIDSVFMPVVYCNADINSKISYSNYGMKTNISMKTKKQSNGGIFSSKCKVDYKNYEMEVRPYVEY